MKRRNSPVVGSGRVLGLALLAGCVVAGQSPVVAAGHSATPDVVVLAPLFELPDVLQRAEKIETSAAALAELTTAAAQRGPETAETVESRQGEAACRERCVVPEGGIAPSETSPAIAATPPAPALQRTAEPPASPSDAKPEDRTPAAVPTTSGVGSAK